ncbi:hypothetical protein [Radicibacter daui]|uniref:hypothetical protein n=1 Tax=Radicibacter daui TaxID=3064829 RepID=UPI004046DEDF
MKKAAAPNAARALALMLVLAVSTLAGQAAASDLWSPFIGTFAGSTIEKGSGVVEKRDLAVTIKTLDDGQGFNVDWQALIYRPDGSIDEKRLDVSFRSSGRGNVYSAAMRHDMFGHDVPLDPMKGEPYLWATIDADTLTVNALIIADDGRFEVQSYVRRLTASGLHLMFFRSIDGTKTKTIEADLNRVK